MGRAFTPLERQARDDAVVRAIYQMTQAAGYPPTHRELMRRLGLCKESLMLSLNRLVAAGVITMDYATPRSLVVREVGRRSSTGEVYRLLHLYKEKES